jgi:hypothetical protein
MKEGTKIVDHLNTFNTLTCQLTSMDVKFEDEDKAVTLLCSLPESWDHLVTSISFSSIDVLDYDTVVGALLTEEMRRKSSQETSTSEAMVARGRSKERGKNQRGTSRSKSKGKKGKLKCWYYVENQGISRRIVGKDNKHPKRTPQRKQIQLKQVQV